MDRNLKQSNLQQICQIVAETSDPKRIELFLKELFTAAELKKIEIRWEILKMLERGETQRDIAKALHVSLCNITRGSKELKKSKSIIKDAVKTF